MSELFTFDDVQTHWPRFPLEADKYSRGVVGLDTGSEQYPGAAVLSVLGAVNSGAGFTRFAGPPPLTVSAATQNLTMVAQVTLRMSVLNRAPSVTFTTGPVDAWVVGCGWENTIPMHSKTRWDRAVLSNAFIVADAGALDFVAPSDRLLLTPHAGELARLLGVDRAMVESTPAQSALEAARRFGCAVLLKGHTQFVAHHSGQVIQLQSGSPNLARAGSGDVLAGVAGTLLAQTKNPVMAGLLAAGFQAWVSTLHVGAYPPDRMAEFMAEHVPGLDLV
ncbi:MAG: NAD(P)H-hydrate dehydratase [Propionibacteriaceae bacterium]|nr:NAD(P)H-hydrate dehydratase [Propionibacteriaceae bacterium]